MSAPYPQQEAREALRAALSAQEPTAICRCLIAVVLADPDRAWLEAQCVSLFTHPSLDVRGLAVTSIGHIARLHGSLEPETIDRLQAVALADSTIAGRSEDALSDIEVFINRQRAAYRTMPGLADLYLESCWVTAINASPGRVEFGMDLALRETHPDYSPSEDGEALCYRDGYIRFDSVSSLQWDSQGAPPWQDVTGEEYLGGFKHFDFVDGEYSIAGDFGRLTISTDQRPVVGVLGVH